MSKALERQGVTKIWPEVVLVRKSDCMHFCLRQNHDKGVNVRGRGEEECPIYLTRLNITNDTLNQLELEITSYYRQARINAFEKVMIDFGLHQ